jgi:glycosyltransferase involved in cell wall biosynthesis
MENCISTTISRRDSGALAPAAKYSSLDRPRQTVSLIVCTRNRAEKLSQALEALLTLHLPPQVQVEFIVVDNGSTDKTQQVLALAEKMFEGRLRRVAAPTPGLGHARNVGLAESQGSILAFVDDDVIPRQDWLETTCREFAADKNLALLSGQVLLRNPLDLPLAIRTSTARRHFDSVSDSFSLLAGCHFAVRREFAERAGGFDDTLGAGTPFPVEDADFFYRVWRAGGKLVYEPSLFAWHDHGRRSPADLRAIVRGYVFGRGAFYSKHVLAKDKSVLQAFYWELVSLSKSLVRGSSKYGWRSLAWLLGGFGFHALAAAWRSPNKRATTIARSPANLAGAAKPS